MMDLDHFKAYNDDFGHPSGDELLQTLVLQTLAQRLESEVRSLDVVARYGGEEFAVILPDTDHERAFAVAERIRKSIESAPFQNALQGSSVRPTFITLSLGVATCPFHATSAQDFIRCADRALYLAKRQGRNQSVGASALRL